MVNGSRSKRSVILCGVSVFFFWVSLYFYVPIFPVYVESLGTSLAMVGTIVSVYAIPQLLFRIPLGIWFDALRKRKPVVVLGIAACIIGSVGLAVSPSPWFLLVARIITGVGAAAWVAFVVYYTGYYRKEDTGKAIGVANFIQGIALVVATSTGGLTAELFGARNVFYGAAVMGVISLFALLPVVSPVAVTVQKVSLPAFKKVFSNTLLLKACGLGILVTFASFSSVFGFVPLYGAEIGASSTDLGIISMLAVGSMAVASLFTVRVIKRYGNGFNIIVSGIIMGAALVAIPFTRTVYQLEIVQVFSGIGQGALRTGVMTMSVKSIEPEQRATAMGVYQATYSIGMLLGPLVSGFLAGGQGLASVFYLSAALSFIVAVLPWFLRLPGR